MSYKILYISYDGMFEPLGQSQVLQYVTSLTKSYNHKFWLISLEKPKHFSSKADVQNLKKILYEQNIVWHPLEFSSAFFVFGGVLNLFKLIALAFHLIRKNSIQLIHARSYIPAIVGFVMGRLLKTPFIFDMRGFWIDERVDTGKISKNSPVYYVGKIIEKILLSSADHIVSLTQAAVYEMQKFSYLKSKTASHFSVIPTCTDVDHFNLSSQPKTDFIVGYVGNATGWYNFDAACTSFITLKKIKPSARLLIVNEGQHDFIKSKLTEHQILDYELTSSQHKSMVSLIQKMDIAIFFIRKLYSKTASMPTRLAEFLACGVPCITGDGIGDVDEIIIKNKLGVVVNNHKFTELDAKNALEIMSDPQTQERCRQAAVRFFSLAEGVKKYQQIYSRLCN